MPNRTGRGRNLSYPRTIATLWTILGLAAFGWATARPAGAAAIQIMPLGDSITWGYAGAMSPVDPGGYRGRLYNILTNDGYNVQFVGSTTENGTGLPAAAQAHEGHIGDVIANSDSTNQSIADNIGTWLGPKGAKPDIVLLMIGTNNIIANHDLENAPFQLGALIKNITELDPKAHVFVSTLLPLIYPNWEQQVHEFNARISGPDGVIAQLQNQGVNVSLVDIGNQLTLADTDDGAHPSPEGYDKVAAAWADAIEGKPLPPGVTPEPSTCLLIGAGALAYLWRGRRSRRPAMAALAVVALGLLGSGRTSEAAATTLRILPLGDSITFGFEGYGVPGDPGGYRGTLYRDLTAAGFNTAFVGSETDNSDPTLPAAAAPQEGHVGYVIQGPMPNGTPGLSENIARWLAPGAADPNLVLLMIGTNNASGGFQSVAAPYQLAALITHITELKPDARILVSTLTPLLDPGAEARVQAYNKALSGPDGVIAQLQRLGEKVDLVDVGGALTTADLIDGVHPTPAGYVKLGDAWFQAIEDTNSTTVPEPSTCLLIGCGALAYLWRGRRSPGKPAVPVLVALGLLGSGRDSGAATLNIMPLGNSITYGFEGTGFASDPGGYRGTLYRDLTAAGYNFQFVGSTAENPDPTLPAAAAPMEGHVGYVIEGPGLNGAPGVSQGVDQWLGPNGSNPNLILLEVGTNNVGPGYRAEDAPYALAALITKITRLEPEAQILVSTLTPINEVSAEARVQAFNKELGGPDGIIAQLRRLGDKVSLVDVGGTLTAGDLQPDGIHPTPAGYVKLGNAWFRAIEQNTGTPVPEPSAFASFAVFPLVALAIRRRGRREIP